MQTYGHCFEEQPVPSIRAIHSKLPVFSSQTSRAELCLYTHRAALPIQLDGRSMLFPEHTVTSLIVFFSFLPFVHPAVLGHLAAQRQMLSPAFPCFLLGLLQAAPEEGRLSRAFPRTSSQNPKPATFLPSSALASTSRGWGPHRRTPEGINPPGKPTGTLRAPGEPPPTHPEAPRLWGTPAPLPAARPRRPPLPAAPPARPCPVLTVVAAGSAAASLPFPGGWRCRFPLLPCSHFLFPHGGAAPGGRWPPRAAPPRPAPRPPLSPAATRSHRRCPAGPCERLHAAGCARFLFICCSCFCATSWSC